MRQQLERRLAALETAGTLTLGLRIFKQDLEDPSIFREGDSGLPWSKAEIDALSRQGWRCVVIEYVDKDDWRGTKGDDKWR